MSEKKYGNNRHNERRDEQDNAEKPEERLIERIDEERIEKKQSDDEQFNYVYMLRCGDDSLYTGWTNDIHKRLKKHNQGKGAKYTRAKGEAKLVHLEIYPDKSTAMKREAAIKKLSRAQKINMISEGIFISDDELERRDSAVWKIRKTLLSMSDSSYRDFHSRLMPTVDKGLVIGVRVPVLKKYAKSIFSEFSKDDIMTFLNSTPHRYYEENNLHGFLLHEIKDFDTCVTMTETFLKYVDNWATCDGLNPPVFKKEKEKLLPYALKWISSNDIYTVRFGIKMLMNHFLDDAFEESFMKTVSLIKSDEYYVQMMQAWYFAEAISRQYDSAVKYFEKGLLSKTVEKMALGKIRDSLKIPREKKEYIKKACIVMYT